ncbi:hypothetical protein Hanom_Chr08g00705021 [Helianthus anomalus]
MVAFVWWLNNRRYRHIMNLTGALRRRVYPSWGLGCSILLVKRGVEFFIYILWFIGFYHLRLSTIGCCHLDA